MKTINPLTRIFLFAGLMLLANMHLVYASPVVRTAAGANAAAIQAAVDQFRADLGGVNNVGFGTFLTGRREVNWDNIGDNSAAPNFLAFNSFLARGLMLSAPNSFSETTAFMVSADSSNPSGAAVRFGNIDASYTAQFSTFSAERLFIARNTNSVVCDFYLTQSTVPATVSGFGAVFTDVDVSGPTFIKYYDKAGRILAIQTVPTANNGLSFAGVSFNAGERVARVEIVFGNAILASPNTDGQGGDDIVAMDDFIYGEPRAAEHHSADFDGDGLADPAVYRPASGVWFVFKTASSTIGGGSFGTTGDFPLDADFDGDSRSDLAVYRPSSGTWFSQNSSDGQFRITQFGIAGDRPVANDYDRDGITDIAVWRPSTGQYFILRSTNGQLQIHPWGASGDIPIAAPPQ